MDIFQYTSDKTHKRFEVRKLDASTLGFYNENTHIEYIWDFEDDRVYILRWHYEPSTYYYPEEHWEEELGDIQLNVPSGAFGTIDPILEQLEEQHGSFESCELYEVL